MTPFGEVLAEKLHDTNPVRALRDMVIRRLTVDEFSRETVLAELDDLRETLESKHDYESEEIVLTVMDHLVGFSNPRWSLAKVGYSDDDEELTA